MQVKVIRQFLNGRQIAHEGDVIEVDERRAAALERHTPPLVVREVGSGSVPTHRPPQQVAGEGANAGGQDPTVTPPTGGPTGEDKPALSSQAVRRPARRASNGRRGKRAS